MAILSVCATLFKRRLEPRLSSRRRFASGVKQGASASLVRIERGINIPPRDSDEAKPPLNFEEVYRWRGIIE
jgi:hypothetical protein